ncbi:phosphoribosylanthranilate isomerase [Staphylococcus aureus]
MKLKFCGFTSIKDVTAANQLPIDAIGFIHYEKSKRHQTIAQIKKLASAVPEHIDTVCVMVNPDLTTIEHVLSNTPINTIQLHGTETVDLIKGIKKKYPRIKIIKALPADEHIIQIKLSHLGYDLASGIEVDGRKDIEKMTAIVNIVKGERENE